MDECPYAYFCAYYGDEKQVCNSEGRGCKLCSGVDGWERKKFKR